jgi:hypothetical protein
MQNDPRLVLERLPDQAAWNLRDNRFMKVITKGH